ncbi:hypothetical protein [Algoriphagus hitonicola]|uniref:Type 1 periplasmic binding fold superfamily protein n=1 Tax=Algoriphagus hitonicola TaxID=435880 RepID=A0A1I2WLB9_9BACT|nr:hypothetical protein [Algoriphagus hitonicola]SFH01427.1 hypothetical protein SAMN04487988_11328 [Algoriphagus hitonicola]
MKTYHKLPIYVLSASLFAFASCESEDPVIENEEEVITDINLNFTELDESGNEVGTTLTFNASDAEGIEVGDALTADDIELETGKTYRLDIEVLNAIENEDITEEVLEEGDEHQFYFLGSAFEGSSAPLTYVYDDESGELIGVSGIVTVSSSPGFNNAQFRVVLRHDLDKNFPGATNPNFSNFTEAGGESDLDVTFPLILN